MSQVLARVPSLRTGFLDNRHTETAVVALPVLLYVTPGRKRPDCAQLAVQVQHHFLSVTQAAADRGDCHSSRACDSTGQTRFKDSRWGCISQSPEGVLELG